MVGEITFLKHELHRDDVKTSDPQETEDSFCHSFPHLIHFTHNVFMARTRLGLSPFDAARYQRKVAAC